MSEVLAYVWHVLILVAIYVPAASALVLLIRQSGMFAVGHNAFCIVGAYAYSLLVLRLEFGSAAAVTVSVALTLTVGYVAALLARRLRGDEFALGSLLFLAAVYGVAYNWTSVTRGASGVRVPPGSGTDLRAVLAFSLLALVAAAASYVLVSRMIDSAFGRSLRALRDDEIAAQAVGRATPKARGHVFAIAAALAGLSGCLYAGYVGYIDPTVFYLDQAIVLLAMSLVSGSRTGAATLLGVVTVIGILEIVRWTGLPAETAQLAFGLGLILLVRFRPSEFAALRNPLRS